MAEILVSGYYGFNNAGDEAILAGIIRAVRDLEPDTTFTVISGTAARTRSLHGVAAVSRNDVKNIWRAIARADLLVSGGGSLLQDISSSKSLPYYLGIVTMARLRGKPVMFYAQGVGPVNGLIGKTLIPLVVNGVDLITVRDQESAETFRRLGVRRPRLLVTADPALANGPSDPEWGADLLREAGVDLDRPVIGVSVRSWNQGEQPLEPALAKALDQIAGETGAQIVFIPLQYPHDIRAGANVARLMETRAVQVHKHLTHSEVQAMIARCDLLIGMRFHALVFAALNGVPLVGLSYDPKNDSFLKLIGEEAAGRTSDLDPGAVVTAARRALSTAPAFRERLLHKIAELTPLSRQNAVLAVELLKRRGRG